MLLVPAWRTTIAARGQATAIVYVHGDSRHSSDRVHLLAELFGLMPREAKLAFALSRGMTLVEAAQHFAGRFRQRAPTRNPSMPKPGRGDCRILCD
jgi:hypothetical protein